jgi:hypothetical protein
MPVHTKLAWPLNPGRPYGTAISNEDFKHDRESGLNFVAWFGDLYGLDSNPSLLPG